jgi:outer membrane protein assembly factor BamE (lipoprotein component of BamABCDE complex)
MMNDLRNRHKLVGMTKRQIVDLLGNQGDTTVSEFYYYLGYSKRGINTGSLTVTFNEKGVVSSFIVRQG